MTWSSRLAAALFTGIVAITIAIAPASAGVPTVKLDRNEAASGEEVSATISSWPAGPAELAICGNDGNDPAADCDLRSAATLTVNADGTGTGTLRITTPPTECPCAIYVVSKASPDFTATVPFTVNGAPVAPGSESPVAAGRTVTVTDVALSGGSWTALFGASTKRTLELTVRNAGTVPLFAVPIDVKGHRSFIESLAVGEESTVQIPVTVSGLGPSTVRGSIHELDADVPFKTRTSTYPFGLIVLVLVAAGVVTTLAMRGKRHSTKRWGEKVADRALQQQKVPNA